MTCGLLAGGGSLIGLVGQCDDSIWPSPKNPMGVELAHVYCDER